MHMLSAPLLLMSIGLVLAMNTTRARGESRQEINLQGDWRFQLDRQDAGEKEQWFSRDLSDRLKLPGCLEEQRFGDPPSSETKWTAHIGLDLLSLPKYAEYQKPGDFKTPFWLTPTRHYVGAAWYQREVEIPADWANRRVVLSLQRPHWETAVWIDEHPLGTR